MRNLSDKERIRKSWHGMFARCYNPTQQFYHRYGGRGITVCKEWIDFENFYKWVLSNGFKTKLEIDRIDNNGNYEPGNCRLVTHKVNSRNRNDSIMITHNNQTMCLSEWAEILGIKPITIYRRMTHLKWPLDKVFSTKLWPNKASKYIGVTFSNDKWIAQMFDKGRRKLLHLGRFLNEVDAAIAYNESAKRIYGKLAKLNRINETLPFTPNQLKQKV